MRSRIFTAIAAALLASGAALAQQANGLLMTQSQFMTTDMLRLSQYNYGFSTARSAAMGGAFASLGSDMASLSINPAGLGMYRSYEFSFTPSLSVMSVDNGGLQWRGGDNSRTRMAIGNMGLALNLYESSRRGLTSLTIGFGYNKLADYNFRSSTVLPTNDYSINEVFVNQLRGLPSSLLGNEARPFENAGIDLDRWGAVMAWKTSAIDNEDGYNDLYTINAISPLALDNHYTQIESTGSMGEYSFALGANFGNKVYLGFAIGVQNIYRKQQILFDEEYLDNDPGADDPARRDRMQYMQYDQSVVESGAAVNFKVGAVIRPVESLRIGLAIHTPSFASIDRTYNASMFTRFYGDRNNYGESSTGKVKFTDDFSSPARLEAGISYTLGSTAIFSVDYESVWYNGMRLGGSAYRSVKNTYKAIIKESFKQTSNIRAGVEVKPLPVLSLRAGYAFYGSPLRDRRISGQNVKGKDIIFDTPLDYRTQNISCGLGFRFNRCVSLDVTYVNMSTRYSGYDLFYYDGEDNYGSPTLIESNPEGPIDSKSARHNVLLTLGVRF